MARYDPNDKQRARRKVRYYQLFAQAQAVWDKYSNACAFDTQGRCFCNRNLQDHSNSSIISTQNGCCNLSWYGRNKGVCKHNKLGCTVKSLGCKLYCCEHMRKIYPQLVYKLNHIRDKAWGGGGYLRVPSPCYKEFYGSKKKQKSGDSI